MSVINPDEWDRTHEHVAEDAERSPLAAQAAIFLCLLDLARYGIRWGTPAPEWVRCVDASGCTSLTVGRVYRVDCRYPAGLTVVDDDNDCGWYMKQRFALATADEATVTIDVPVAWARWQIGTQYASAPWMTTTTVRDACREALTKAGLL